MRPAQVVEPLQPRPAPVVVGRLSMSHRLVDVLCPHCGTAHQLPVTVGAYEAPCGMGLFRVVLQMPDGGNPA